MSLTVKKHSRDVIRFTYVLAVPDQSFRTIKEHKKNRGIFFQGQYSHLKLTNAWSYYNVIKISMNSL